MGDFVRGATDTIIGSVDGDISSSSNIELWIDTFNETFKHNRESLSFVSVSGGKTLIGYKLTQQESLSCCQDYIYVQVRWIDSGGNVGATKRKLLSVDNSEWNDIIPLTPSQDESGDLDNIERITEPEILAMITTEG